MSVSAPVPGEREHDDELVSVAPLLDRVGDFAAFLGVGEDQRATRALRMAETTGRLVGGATWLEELGAKTGRGLAAQKRGSTKQEFRLLSP